MSLDEQLLEPNKLLAQSAQRAADLREARRSEISGSKSAGSGASQENEGTPASLREAVKEEKKKDGEKGAGDKIASAATAPMRKGTSKMLRQAWLHLIDSWGLTLIWINIHVFLRQILGEKLFCDLGEEWKDMIPAAGAAGAPEVKGVKDAGGDQSGTVEQATKATGLIEKMGCGCLDLGCLFTFLAIVCLMAMIVGVIDNPLKALASLLTGIWEQFTGTNN
ncbi:MAG: hypothetical protein Q8N57_03960 [bacterium]|nr:hypothetical protein [bacterium]